MQRNHYTIILIFYLLLSSCTAPIDIRTNDSEPVVVIYGRLTDELKHHSVSVSVSSPYFDSEPNRKVSGALVQVVSSADDTIRFAEVSGSPGLYETLSPTAAVSGLSYRLRVEADYNLDGVPETFSAVSTMPVPQPVDSIRVESIGMMGRLLYAVRLYMQDYFPERNYYLDEYEVNGESVSKGISKHSVMNDDLFSGQYVHGLTIRMFRNAEDEYDWNDDSDYHPLRAGDRVTLLFSHIEKGYYDFTRQARDVMEGETPFGGPPSNIVTNISNGGVGYFSCYPVSSTTATVP